MKRGTPSHSSSLAVVALAALAATLGGCETADQSPPKVIQGNKPVATSQAKPYEVPPSDAGAPVTPKAAALPRSVIPSLVPLKRSENRVPVSQLVPVEKPDDVGPEPVVVAAVPAPAPKPAVESRAPQEKPIPPTPVQASVLQSPKPQQGWLLGLLTLLAAVYVAYRFSRSAATNRSLRDLRRRIEGLGAAMQAEPTARSAAVQAAAQAHRNHVTRCRMAALSIDDIRRLAPGARTQPLRDHGVSSLLDCHTWDANRFVAFKGIGPDSAYKLAAACATLKKGVHEKPIPHPKDTSTEPTAHRLFERIHEQLRSRDILKSSRESLTAMSGRGIANCLAHESRTTFWSWLVGTMAKRNLVEALNSADAVLRDPGLSKTMDEADRVLGEARSVRAGLSFDPSHEVGQRPEYLMTLEHLFGPDVKHSRQVPPIAPPRIKSPPPEPPPSEPVLVRPSETTAPTHPSGYRIEVKIASVQSEAKHTVPPHHSWIGFGESRTIHGRTVEGPLYVGQGLRAAGTGAIEPALIDPKLPVAADGDHRVRMLDYWSNYSHASPQARASYLDWLAGGKNDPEADLSYVFLYFYGLERRALADQATGQSELLQIIAEVHRLRAIYSRNRSFAGYSSEFLDYISAVQADGPSDELPPLVRYTLPLALRRKLGTFAAADAPLPALWAHAWHYCDPRTRLPAAAERCPELAKALFELRYYEEFGAGVLLPASRTRIKMTYRPASASFGSSFVHGLDLPDVTVMTSVYEKIDQVAARCFKELDPYSRFIWRNRDSKDSAEAKLLLPPVLWPAKAREAIQAQAAAQETASALKSLLGMFGIVEKFTRAQYRSLTQGLAAAGVGIEPDLRFTNEVPGVDDPVTIFPSGQGDLGAGFPTASLMVQLAAAVATADGKFSQEEAAKLRAEINRMPGLSSDGRRRLEARASVYRIKPPGTTGLKSAIAPLDVDTRLKVAEVAVGVISGTGVVERAEVKVMETIYALLGLEAATLYSRLHGLAASPAVQGQTPAKAVAGRMQLDADRVAKLKATSDEVTRKLAAIFVDESTSVEAPPDLPAEPEFQTSNPLGLALDRLHDDLAALLFTRAQWTRAEFEEICSDKGLMPDGAIESINEAAFEKFDQPVIEGEDPLEISLHLEKAPAA